MNKKIKKQIPNIIFGLIFLAGIAIFLYPSVSNYINSKHQSRAISNYEELMNSISEEDYTRFWNEAIDDNERLAQQPLSFNLSEEELAEYESILDPTGTGIMGYIEIENIGVHLPIYHRTTESVLQVGIGHLEGTSFPTGTVGTHTVLSGHRGLPSSKLFSDLGKLCHKFHHDHGTDGHAKIIGLPSAKLFSDLDQMIVGDTFLLHIMDKTFAYQVDQIKIVLPEETNDLAIADDKEYVTLVTCTPYGVNTHRMLVRAKRVDYSEESKIIVPADASRYGALWVAPFIAAPLLFTALLIYQKQKEEK